MEVFLYFHFSLKHNLEAALYCSYYHGPSVTVQPLMMLSSGMVGFSPAMLANQFLECHQGKYHQVL